MDNLPSLHLTPWLSLVGIILLQSVSNTNSNFSSYSSQLVQLLPLSKLQLNNLFVALETGKLLNYFPEVASNHLPIWVLLITGVIFGFIGYGLQFIFLVKNVSSVSHWHLVLLQVLAGNSISWIKTLCVVTGTKNFPIDSSTVVALTSTYASLSGKMYTLMVEVVHGQGKNIGSTYLLLNCLVPLGFGIAFLILVREYNSEAPLTHTQDQVQSTYSTNTILAMVFMVGLVSEVYVVLDSVAPAFHQLLQPRLRLVILISLILLPLLMPIGMVLVQLLPKPNKLDQIYNRSRPQKRELSSNNPGKIGVSTSGDKEDEIVIRVDNEGHGDDKTEEEGKDNDDEKVVTENHFLKSVGDEHEVKDLLLSVNFWLYFWAYACGATLTMAYFNDLECISKSFGNSETGVLLGISSSFGFFGRLFTVMLNWFTRGKHISRPSTIAILMIPMAATFFLLLKASNNHYYFYISTAILGTCSGIITSISSTITFDLFGSTNYCMNHQFVLANVPVACLIFGYLSALITNGYRQSHSATNPDQICISVDCYYNIFLVWGSICSFGTILSFILHLRTFKFYMQRH